MPLTRFHRVVLVLACVVTPLATLAFDGHAVGYTMYAGITTYKLEVVAKKRDQETRVSCNDVAHAMGGSAALFLFGADAWRQARSTRALRAHLDAVGRAACIVAPADSVEVTLEERDAETAHWVGACP